MLITENAFSKSKADWVGKWFQFYEEDGYDVSIWFQIFDLRKNSQSEFKTSHSTHDGLSGLLSVLKEKDLLTSEILPRLPKMTFLNYVAGTIGFLLSPFFKKHLSTTRWKNQLDEKEAKARWGKDHMVSFAFSEEETKAILSAIKKKKSNLVLLSLKMLDEAVRPFLTAPNGKTSWMLPMTMRSQITPADTIGNQASFLSIDLTPDTDLSQLKSLVRRKLLLQEQWRTYFLLSIGTLVKERGMRWLYSKMTAPSQRIGSFANMGKWGNSSSAQSEYSVFGAGPTTAFQPLSSAQAIWCDRLHICLRLNSSVLIEQNRAETILEQWCSGLRSVI